MEHTRNAAEIAHHFDPARLPPEFYDDPYPTYAALREHAPLHRCADGTWFLTSYADLDRIYRARERVSSDKKDVFAPKYGVESPLFAHHTTSLVFNDPPYHTRVRRQIVGALTPRVMKAIEPDLAALVERLIESMRQRGRFDLIEDFAAAIPVEVIGNLLRVPHDERGPLRGWSLAILGALETALTPEQREHGERSVRDFLEYLGRLVAERRRHLGGEDDMLSRLIRDEAGGAPLSEHELLHNCIFLLNAGHETTTNLIGNGLALLLTHPEQFARLRENPALINPCVEECLRYESPNQLGNRLVVQPIEVCGTRLEPGAYLTLCIGAANRDPGAFRSPERFDISRSPNPHLAFAAGAHACAGMSVARLEAQIALHRVAQRMPDLKLLPAAERSLRARFRGFKRLPAAVDAQVS
jgi:cytochrome P450